MHPFNSLDGLVEDDESRAIMKGGDSQMQGEDVMNHENDISNFQDSQIQIQGNNFFASDDSIEERNGPGEEE